MRRINLKEILRQTLENAGISESYYSIKGYKEGATCMEKQVKYMWYMMPKEQKNIYIKNAK